MAKDGNSKWVTGTVARLIRDRGFGFLQPEGGGGQVFFHMSAMSQRGAFDQLNAGDAVKWIVADPSSLDARRQGMGPRAATVEKL